MKVLCLFSTFLFALSPCVSIAWQEDMHYGLTKWLALKAGIAENQAELLAKGNQDIDTIKHLKANEGKLIGLLSSRGPDAARVTRAKTYRAADFVGAIPTDA